MATPKKKHLIELMIEAGVSWPEGAEYAAQDKDGLHVYFFTEKPIRSCRDKFGVYGVILNSGIRLNELCRNWHQTIVTREQYEKAIAGASIGQSGEIPSNEPVNTQSENLPVATSSTLEELLSNYQRYQQLTAEALQALQNKGKQLGLVITIDESK